MDDADDPELLGTAESEAMEVTSGGDVSVAKAKLQEYVDKGYVKAFDTCDEVK